jgi:hypothetical protein
MLSIPCGVITKLKYWGDYSGIEEERQEVILAKRR